MTLPPEIEESILRLTGASEPGKLRRLRENLRLLARDFSGRAPAEDEFPEAHLAYHFPTNLMKTIAAVREIDRLYPGRFPARDHYEVLDLGCGEGAGMFGFFFARDDRRASFHLRGIESSARMLEKAGAIAERLRPKHENLKAAFTRSILSSRPDRGLEGRYDAILCVNSLAEIIPDGPIVIEPALKVFSRRLMALRGRLSEQGSAQIILPCLHGRACPLLGIATRDEWCHETRTWTPPAYLSRLNQGLNREIDRLKYSCLVLAKDKIPARPDAEYRVVSRRLKEKGRLKCFLCAPDGRIEMARQDKHRSEANAAFDEIKQGDVVRVENADLRGLYMRIKPDTKIKIIGRPMI